MHAVLATLGTDGDIIPYAGLGSNLRDRGHRVTLVTGEPARALAARIGLEFRPLLSTEETNAPLADPNFWHPTRGPVVAARWGRPHISRHFALLDELAAGGDTVLVASPAILAARLVHEVRGTPLATVILQPWMIPSVSAPPVMPAFSLPPRMPRWAGQVYWRLVDVVGTGLAGHALNVVRAKMGLRPVRRLFQWWYSPDLVIGMFPASYGVPQDDWLPQIRLTGFPMFDGQPTAELPPDVDRFCADGPPPVAFTFGTGMMHAATLFRNVLQVCESLEVRAILLTRYREQLPSTLPPTVMPCPSAPFLSLFPRCAAVVHHGGIGTVAKALATGTPQLIVPMGFDQFDNAVRVRGLGAGTSARFGRSGSAGVTEALASILRAPVRARCRELAQEFQAARALDEAADLVEALARQPRPQSLAERIAT